MREVGLTVYVEGNGDQEVERGVVGDLLSFIMRTAPDGAVWVTIQITSTWQRSRIEGYYVCYIGVGKRAPSGAHRQLFKGKYHTGLFAIGRL